VADSVKKLPGDVSHLQRLIGDHATDRGMPPARLQRWLNAMIVTAVLDRVRDEDGEPIFLLKGGLAMELRLQLRARATGDFDAAFRARAEEVIDRLDEALAVPWNSFDLTRDAPETIPNTKAVRIRLRLSYKRRSWGSVYLEMAPVEGKMGRELDRVKAMALDPLQIPLPEAANCVSLRYQVAQKLHACTEVFDEGRENDRFRDVMDILLVEDLRPSANHPRPILCPNYVPKFASKPLTFIGRPMKFRPRSERRHDRSQRGPRVIPERLPSRCSLPWGTGASEVRCS